MGNKPGRSEADDDAPHRDLPVVQLALEAAEQRLVLSMLAHPRLGCGSVVHALWAETALLPSRDSARAVYGPMAQRVAEAMPFVWAGRYSGTWAMTSNDELDQQREGAEISGLTGQGPTTDERQYCYGVTIDTMLFEVRRQSPREVAHVTGSIEWKLLRAPRSAPKNLSARVGETALEHVRGSLSPAISLGHSSGFLPNGGPAASRLDLTGFRSSDPTLIGTDSYRLSLVASNISGGGTAGVEISHGLSKTRSPGSTSAKYQPQQASSELRGVSRGAHGKWDAQLQLKRVAALVHQDADGFFTAVR
jgi:hypothetical protein